jgi:hypothetical protein
MRETDALLSTMPEFRPAWGMRLPDLTHSTLLPQ